MKALSIRQPWAELILQGRKTIELRTWTTAYRGPVVIHAGYFIEDTPCRQFDIDPTTVTRGALVGIVNLVEIIQFDAESWPALRDAHLSDEKLPGFWKGWRLTHPRRLVDPLVLNGQPGVFDLRPEIVAQLRWEEDK